MKHKILFGLQVFTTLILLMGIFISYLERSEAKQSTQQEEHKVINAGSGDRNQLASLLTVAFEKGSAGAVSCGR